MTQGQSNWRNVGEFVRLVSVRNSDKGVDLTGRRSKGVL